jgi:hypothetical protein
VHEADPQKKAMAPSLGGVHEANATLDVTFDSYHYLGEL